MRPAAMDSNAFEGGDNSRMDRDAKPAVGGGDVRGAAESARAACDTAWAATVAWADATNRGVSSGRTPDELRAMQDPGTQAMRESDERAVVERAVSAAEKWDNKKRR